jgi:diguanylate cyclase (GGDEF)-like protein
MVAIAVVDLDRFKQVNDAIGHRNADHALVTLAQRMEQALSGADSLARYGGDEFALLMEDVRDADDATARAQHVRAAVAAPLVVGGKRLAVTASVGVALSDGARAAEALLRNADLALQQAQSAGGDGCELFEAERHVRTLQRLSLESELPQLIEREAFAVLFQPVLSLPERGLAALYVRLGWREPEHAATPIPTLLAAAAESGQGALLGRWLQAAMARDLRALLRYLPDAARLSLILRVDPRELREADFAQRLATTLKSVDLQPRQLLLKLPAAAFARTVAAAPGRLEPLETLGVRMGLADFGSGQAGLELLDSAPVDALFLSRPLVQRLESGPRPGALARVAVAAGRALAATVIAPGVTSESQLERLSEIGCNLAYGDAVAPALPFQHLLPWLGARFAEAAEPQG